MVPWPKIRLLRDPQWDGSVSLARRRQMACADEASTRDEVRIQLALRGGADHARENRLTLGPIPGPIPATDLPCHDDRSDRVVGAAVGGIDRWIKQEGSDRREFAIEMRGESPHVRHAAGTVESRGETAISCPRATSSPAVGISPHTNRLRKRSACCKIACTSVAKLACG